MNWKIDYEENLKEIPTKRMTLHKNVTSLTSQVAELKTLQWELPAEFLSLPVASVQAKLKILDALPSLLLNVTYAVEQKKELKKFDFVTESGEHVHLTKERISAQKKIEEEAKAEAARHEGEMRKEELIDLLGPEVVKKKGPITLKVYREDDTSEIIPEFKASDLHLGEWREVVKACPNKKGKGWTSIYKQIQERIDYLRTTEAELGIDLDRPLSEQDPLDRLNDLANKKRKHADDIHDFFRANKRLKQDFVTIKDFRDFSNTMLKKYKEGNSGLNTNLLQTITKVQLDESANTLQFSSVLRRLGSIFTLVYAAVQKLKKAFGKGIRVLSFEESCCTSIPTFRSYSQGDCFIPFDIKQSFSRFVNSLEVKQHVSTSVKEIDNVQLGIVNQAELKLLPKAFFSFCTAA
ncbi:hypothetical protein Tco_0024347 [Tanacetum coccineum]